MEKEKEHDEQQVEYMRPVVTDYGDLKELTAALTHGTQTGRPDPHARSVQPQLAGSDRTDGRRRLRWPSTVRGSTAHGTARRLPVATASARSCAAPGPPP